MKIQDPAAARIAAATDGDLAALDEVLRAIQGGVYNLAVRMLGNRDDAADATQEILLKVVTHLAGFRAESRFSTWVYAIARHHLLNAVTRTHEPPTWSLDALGDELQRGLDFADRQRHEQGERALTPEDKAMARQTALACTQGFLMALDREHRLAYVLDLILGLDSNEAAAVCDITPAAHRQRLARARARLDGFVGHTCGLASETARCRCERQVPALKHRAAAREASEPRAGARQPTRVVAITPAEHAQAEHQFGALVRLGDAAAVLRAHPEYQAPEAQLGALRALLASAGLMKGADDAGGALARH